jgi:transposase
MASRGPDQWLYAGLTRAGFDIVLLETRHVKAALSVMVVKTDRKNARGIAQLIRMGWFRAVHAESASSQEIRTLLTARRLLLDKLRDVELIPAPRQRVQVNAHLSWSSSRR